MPRSLSNRLIIAISAVVLFLGVLGALLVARVSALGGVTQRILRTNAHVAVMMSTMREAAQGYALATPGKARARIATRFAASSQGFADDTEGLHVGRGRARVWGAWKAYRSRPDAVHLQALDRALERLRGITRAAIGEREHRAISAIKELTIFASLGLGASLFAILMLSVWMVRLILRPMRQLARSIHDLSPVGTHRELERYGLVEFDDLTREFNGLLRRLDKYERGNTEKLVYENAKIDALINSIDDGLVLLDRQGKILHVNFMAGMLLQTEPGELLGRNINDLNIATRFYMNLRNALMSLRRENQDEPQYSRNEFSLTIRGRLHYYILKTVPFRDKSRSVIGLIVVLQDVTELRHAEHQRTQLLATLSHELKTPLTSLSLSIGTLYETTHQDNFSAQVRQLLEIAKEEVGRLTMLVEDLLDVSRPDAIRASIDLRPLELCEFLRRQVHSFRLQAELQDVDMVAQCLPEVAVNADPVKLGWVFNNLLSNALRHTPLHGQITVTVSKPSDDEVLMEVADTGRGIPPEELPRIFEWFTQGTGDRQGSAGMGLAIVREMVEAHGGRITVASKVNEGTVFRISLPRHMTAADLPLQPVVSPPTQG